jgi:hypothetical protein
MGTYADEYHATNTYATANGAGTYASWAGFAEPPSMWADLVGVDPMATAMLSQMPVFFDALYEPRMVTTYQNMTWYTGENVMPRHIGGGVRFNNGVLANIEYNQYLQNQSFTEGSIAFVAQTTQATAVTYDCLMTFFGDNEHFDIVIQDNDGAVGATNASVNFYFQQADAGVGEFNDYGWEGGQNTVNDGQPHLVCLTWKQQLDGTTYFAMTVDGLPHSYLLVPYLSFPILDKFFVGSGYFPVTGDTPTDTTISHLAIYDFVLDPAVLAAWPANTSIPAEGGYYAVVDGRWRQFLL